MDYYELAERTRVYPEWEQKRLVFSGPPAPIAGAASVSASLTKADELTTPYELMVFCEFADYVPGDISECVKPEGTYRTTHYQRTRTRGGRLVGLRTEFFRHEVETIDDVVNLQVEQVMADTHRKRPMVRVNDGFVADWHDDFGTELIR